MEVAVPEEPQKKIFRARKTMKMSDRHQLEVLHNTLTITSSNSSSSSSRPQTPLVNGTHVEDEQKGKEKDKESVRSPSSPLWGSSPPPLSPLSLSRSSSPVVTQSRNASPSPSVKSSEKGNTEEKTEEDRKDKKNQEAEKTEISKSASAESPSCKKNDEKKNPADKVLNGELAMDTDSTSLEHGSAEEKSSKSSSSSPFGSPAASLECDPEVKEGFLCLSEEDEGQGEQDEVKEEKMDVESVKEEKKEGEKGCKAADGSGNSTPAGKKRSLSPVEKKDDCKDGEFKEERDGKRPRVEEGVQLEAQLELKITAKAGSRLKLEKLVKQLVEERLRVLQMTVFDRNLQELKERVEKIDVATKQQNTVQHTLQSKIARLSKKFGAANQASENNKKVQDAAAAAKTVPVAPPTTMTPTTQRAVRAAMETKQVIAPPGSSSSTATPTQPKPLSTPTTPTSSALAAPAPIIQIISTTTNSTPSSSSSSLSGQAQTGTLLLQSRPSAGGMTTSTATSAGQPMSIQPLLIQLPLAVANGQGGAIAGGVGLIPVSSLGTVSSISKAKTTTATTFILQKTPGSLVSQSPSLSTVSTAVTQIPLNRPVYQGGTVTASSPSAGVSVTTARAPTQSAAVVGMATASSSPATTGPAATGSAAAANGPPSASEMASKTDNQATQSTPTKSTAQPGRPKGSVIDLTEDDDDVQVTGVQKAAVPAISATTQRPQGTPSSTVSSSSVARTVHRSSVDSPSRCHSSSSPSASLPPLPIAPPPPARLPPEAAHTSPPQQPQLKLARVQSQNGIVLSWCVSETERNCAPVDSYHLYAYHQDQQVAPVPPATQSPNHSLWKKIGEVKALPLPMACTLTQFVSGSTYYFAVRAKDVYGRFGPFCDPQCTDVINPPSSSAS